LELLEYILESTITAFGNGLSSFGPIFVGEDIDIYPHNFFAEIVFEFGVLGGMVSLYFVWLLKRVATVSLIGYLSIYYFVNAMFSGDVPGNGQLFIAAVAAGELYKVSTKNLTSSNFGKGLERVA
jgi:hypothetical protein